MRRSVASVFVVGLAALAITLSGCGYKPDDGQTYFETDGAYRVIEADFSATRTIRGFGLEPVTLTPPREPITITVDHFFAYGTLFYYAESGLTPDGVKVVYECLGQDNYGPLNGEAYLCINTWLMTNNCVKEAQHTFTVNPDGAEGNDAYGFVCDVTAYTFNYTDFAKDDGRRLGAGSFEVFVCEDYIYLDYYKTGSGNLATIGTCD